MKWINLLVKFPNACHLTCCERFMHYLSLIFSCHNSWKGRFLWGDVCQILQSFSLLKPFLTIDCKLAFRSASIQSTTAGENNVLHCIVSFHSELHHNTEEKTFFQRTFFCHILWFRCLKSFLTAFPRIALLSICKCADLCESQSFSGDMGVMSGN